MRLWIIAALTGIGFATSADALIVPRGIGIVGGNAPDFLPVYPGCDLLPSAPAAGVKYWYFDVVNGKSPSAGGNGTVGNPYNEIRAIWGQNSGVNWTGWSQPLAANAVYKHSSPAQYFSDFTSSGNLTFTATNGGTITAGADFAIASGARFISTATVTLIAGTPTNIAVRALTPGAAGNIAASTAVAPAPLGFSGTVLNSFSAALDGSGTTGGTASTKATGNLVLTVTSPGAITSQATFKDPVSGTTFMPNVPETDINSPGTYTIPIIAKANGTASNLVGSTPLDPNGTLFAGSVLTGVAGAVGTGGLTGGQDIGVGSDPTHSRLWPGDVVVLVPDGPYPDLQISSNNSDQSEGGSYLIDNGAAPVWIEGNGSGTPVINTVKIASFKGLIFDGIKINYVNPQAHIGSANMRNGIAYGNVNPSPGDTITIYDGTNVDTWTWVASGATGFQINIGADAGVSAANGAAALTANAPGGVATASFTYTHAGTAAAKNASISFFGVNGFSTPVQAMATTTIGNNTVAPTGLMMPLANASNNVALKINGTFTNPTANIGFHNINVVTGPYAGTDGQLDDYPFGSLGINPITGVVDQPTGPTAKWNNADWLYQIATGVSINGNYNGLSGANLKVGGTTCISVNGMNVKYALNGFGVYETAMDHFQNVALDYSTQDGFENYSDDYIEYENISCNNPLENSSGAHPDCFQTGSVLGLNLGNFWHDISIDRLQLYPHSDSQVDALTYPDYNGALHNFATPSSGILLTIDEVYNLVVTNSLVYTHACNGIVGGQIYNSTFVGNTVMWDGTPTDVTDNNACNVAQAEIYVGASNATANPPISPPYNITLVNNVFSQSPTTGCNLGYTFVGNYMTQLWANGAQAPIPTTAFGNCADDGTTYVLHPPWNSGGSWESNGLTSLGATAVSSIYTAYNPPPSGLYSTATLNGAPTTNTPPNGFWKQGTSSPPATTTNVFGAARTSPPSPGAF